MTSTAPHVGITVRGVDAAVEFYSTVFGCRLIRRFTPGRHDGIRTLVGLPDADLDAAFVALPDGRVIELLHFRAPEVGGAGTSPAAPGTVHLAVPVGDLPAVMDRLRSAGGSVVGAPVRLDDLSMAYARDPDGTLLEIIATREETS